MIGDYLPETDAPDPLEEATAVLEERLAQTEIAANALRDLEHEAEERRGPLLTERFSMAELMQMSPEDRAAALSEFEEHAALAAVASGEVVAAGLGELGELGDDIPDVGDFEEVGDFEDAGDDEEDDHDLDQIDSEAEDDDGEAGYTAQEIRVAELEGELAALQAITQPSVLEASQRGRQYELQRLNTTYHAAIDYHVEQGSCAPETAERLRGASWAEVIGLAAETLEARASGQPRRAAQRVDRSASAPMSQLPAGTTTPTRVRISAPEVPHTVVERRPVRRSGDRRGGLPSYAYGPDGFPTERFEREVKAGLWLGSDL